MMLKVLATDLDGTLIPLDGNPDNPPDLKRLEQFLAQHHLELLFVTGRHFQSVQDAIGQHGLPQPDWMICDVGTTLMHREDGQPLKVVQAYHDQLAGRIESLPIAELSDRLKGVAGLRKQELEKQGPFKLSYYTDAARIEAIAEEIQLRLEAWSAPYSIISSVDPFNNDGLVDLLPSGVSKAFALSWWADHTQITHDAILFAGDSGNDLAALTAGYRTIVVSNAADALIRQVSESHRIADWDARLFVATKQATSGVLEGLRHFVR
ncbi:HAD-IIB family hydrolase [Novipirellula artificiosorum]|uniref:Mannosylfructose-phosphate phosphatase n=1 Tax=Novipirellula artificiosorum TaxID=2528016 RepID=A0A5C6D9T3_9BACT|nr:HAD-IIB family hydrolase [Novipirellula artificiosorum]TWU33682.1 Mannosylfructose-phosphate phosphatase [Novipirellula artificiosorum]